MDKILFIVARTTSYPLHLDNGEIVMREPDPPHYELHFDKRVEFWTLDGHKLGESKVERVD